MAAAQAIFEVSSTNNHSQSLLVDGEMSVILPACTFFDELHAHCHANWLPTLIMREVSLHICRCYTNFTMLIHPLGMRSKHTTFLKAAKYTYCTVYIWEAAQRALYNTAALEWLWLARAYVSSRASADLPGTCACSSPLTLFSAWHIPPALTLLGPSACCLVAQPLGLLPLHR